MQQVRDKEHIIRSKQFRFGALDSKSEIEISTTNLSTCGLAIGDLYTNYQTNEYLNLSFGNIKKSRINAQRPITTKGSKEILALLKSLTTPTEIMLCLPVEKLLHRKMNVFNSTRSNYSVLEYKHGSKEQTHLHAGCALPRSLQLSCFVHITGKVQGSQSIKEAMLHYFLNNKN